MSTGCTVEPLVGRVGELGEAVSKYYRRVITKMIPRRPVFGMPAWAPTRRQRARPSRPPSPIASPPTTRRPMWVCVRWSTSSSSAGRSIAMSWQELVRRIMKERCGRLAFGRIVL